MRRAPSVQVKRVYDPPSSDDGVRILVDRLWPRRLTKAGAAVDLWLKDIAPSLPLRRWFNRDPARWAEFTRRYAIRLGVPHEKTRVVPHRIDLQILSVADEATARRVRIQYGGSVKPSNARELMSQPDVDGALVGGASLEAQSFAAIVKNSI